MPKLPPQQRIKLIRRRLDDAAVRAHFASVAETGLAVEVRTKGCAGAYSEAASSDLRELGDLLCRGEVEAIQLRFAQDGAWWCDTVTRVRGSYRLVRMRQGDVTGSPATS